jgi:hypothetical protein
MEIMYLERAKTAGITWTQLKKADQNTVGQRDVVVALCSTPSLQDQVKSFPLSTHLYSTKWEWDLVEQSERCASMPKIVGSNPRVVVSQLFVLICC